MPDRRARKKALDFDDVRRFGLGLPGMEESTMYGTPALKVNGNLVACIASHKSAEPGTLVARVDFDERDELIATDPDTYYLTDHYVNYTSVLVRLSRIHPDALRDLIHGAWRFMSAKPPAKKRTVRRPRHPPRPRR
jgi:hypothetical protein